GIAGLSDTVFQMPRPLEREAAYVWSHVVHAGVDTSLVPSQGVFMVVDGSIPPTSLLYQNFPNPFPAAGRDSTCLWFDLASAAVVELAVLDLRGNAVRRFVPGPDFPGILPAGRYGRSGPGGPTCDARLMWDGRADDGRELPMLVYALEYATVPARHEPLVILGPPGVVRLVKALAPGYGPWLLDPGFPIGILDVRDGEPFPLDAEVNLETFPVPHTPESVALAVAAPEGRLVYTGDTGPSSKLAQWATGADLLLAECSLPEALAMDIHLTPERAGDLAREAGARRLVLTHFYPPVETSDPARAAGARFKGPNAAARDRDRFVSGEAGGVG